MAIDSHEDILKIQKALNDVIFAISPDSDHFSTKNGWTSSFKVELQSFLSVKKSSNSIILILAQPIEVSKSAQNAEKCNFCCDLAKIQSDKFPKFFLQ